MVDSKSSLRRMLRWLGMGLLVLILSGVIFLIFAPNGWWRNFVNTKGSAFLGRDFAIDGGINIDWDWTQPEITLKKVRIANLPEGKEPDMARIEELDFQIRIWRLLRGELNLPKLNITRPRIILEKFTPTKKNWDFPPFSEANLAKKAALPEERGDFPVIGRITIKQGSLIYRDKPRKLVTDLGINIAQGGSTLKNNLYSFSGKGTLQDHAFTIDIKGGPPEQLRDESKPYPLELTLVMGATRMKVDGTFTDPVKMTGVDAKLNMRGDNLADLFFLTKIPLPTTPPYQLSGKLKKIGEVWGFNDFKGKVGDSDMSGDLSYDVGKERGFVKAKLFSRLLDMKDLAGFIGATPERGTLSSEQKEQAAKNQQNPHLLPDVPIDLTRLRATDMDVIFKAIKVNAPGWPLNDLDFRVNLQKGILRLDPLNFGIANGDISGSLILNGQKKLPLVESDLILKQLSLKQFFTDPKFASLAAGHFGGRFKLKGNGLSLADVLASSDGHITLLMSGGSISLLIIEAAGIDLGQALPLLLGKDNSTGIRCAIGDFNVKNGLLNSDIFVFDTTDSNINGNAQINLKDETINARIEVNPKDFSILSAKTPILIEGRLKQPKIGLDTKSLATRVAAAGVLGAFLTPVAAIIPFIELGLGKDSDCRGLIEQARGYSEKTPGIDREGAKKRPHKRRRHR
ncbi:MAG: AsmA family protein [Methylococcales bacterium]|nr:AsmA family protein [Methylococcales bacterium]